MPKAKASKRSELTQPKSNEVLQWLESMPEGFTPRHADIAVPVTLKLDSTAWTIYARGAKLQGVTLEEMVSAILCDVDLHFEESGYRTDSQVHDQRRREEAEAKGGTK